MTLEEKFKKAKQATKDFASGKTPKAKLKAKKFISYRTKCVVCGKGNNHYRKTHIECQKKLSTGEFD